MHKCKIRFSTFKIIKTHWKGLNLVNYCNMQTAQTMYDVFFLGHMYFIKYYCEPNTSELLKEPHHKLAV